MAASLLLSSARAFGRLPVASSSTMRSAMATSKRLAGGASKASLTTEDDKALYTLGRSVGRQLGELNLFNEAELDQVLSGIKESVLNVEPPLDLNEYSMKAQAMFQTKMEAKAKESEAAGQAALDEAAKVEGAVTTDSGLVFLSTEAGSGDKPKASDSVKVHYEGFLVDGTVFDSSIARGEPIEFPLSGVIPGWSEGVQLMSPGGKATLTMPSTIAYGARGSPPAIPPGATLVFNIELFEIK